MNYPLGEKKKANTDVGFVERQPGFWLGLTIV
jgi:hypothetical protein